MRGALARVALLSMHLAHALSLCALSLSLSACGAAAAPASSPAPTTSTSALSLTYLGVAGWQLDDGPHTLLFDPYFTRADVTDDAATLVPDRAAIARYAPSHADVILVGHSHYDHLLDVPTIATATGAIVLGTESTVHVARAAGIPASNAIAMRGGDARTVGPFSVRAIHALHSLTGIADAPIPEAITLPMKAGQFGEGGTLQYLVEVEGRSILFIGTANFVESEVTGLHPDIAIIATGLRSKIPDYTCRLLRAIGLPKRVYPNHFDNHRAPLGPETMTLSKADLADLARFTEEVHACSPATTVVVPKHLERMAL